MTMNLGSQGTCSTSGRGQQQLRWRSRAPTCQPLSTRQTTTRASSTSKVQSGRITEADLEHLQAAAQESGASVGLTQPHPNAACVLVGPDGRVLTSAHQRAQGTASAEAQAVQQAGPAARGATAYLNLESGDCHGDATAIRALLDSGVSRVVVGLRNPLPHLRSKAVAALRSSGVAVDVLGEAPCAADPADEAAAYLSCLDANEALLHRAALRRPLSILKYAMTLDGKIATSQMHSAWVSSPASRAMVFEARARSDAVVVGGNTVRRDNPRLTTRRDGGHQPVRVVMSRTLDLPEDACLWDVTHAPTIVMTQRGAKQAFQAKLRAKGVEVVQFDFLTPENVADYCYERGFLQCFWECGGTLAAPSIASGVIHKVMAFIAPKIIGGDRAPTPVGELGFVEMTQAVDIRDTVWRPVGPDMMLTGYLPSSGGLLALEQSLAHPGRKGGSSGGGSSSSGSGGGTPGSSGAGAGAGSEQAAALNQWQQAEVVLAAKKASGGEDAATSSNGSSSSSSSDGTGSDSGASTTLGGSKVVSFYKAWDQWGAFSNFSPHTILMPTQPIASTSSSNGSSSATSSSNGNGSSSSTTRAWPSVEHFYQASKFSGVDSSEAWELVESIAAAPSPEEAARIGRRAERTRRELLRPDWATAKVAVMAAALEVKFRSHTGPREMLLATAAGDGDGRGYHLVENSPHDFFWGRGFDGSGRNQLGRLLMGLRERLVAEGQQEQVGLQEAQRQQQPVAA